MLSVVQLSMWTHSRSGCWDKEEGQVGFGPEGAAGVGMCRRQ